MLALRHTVERLKQAGCKNVEGVLEFSAQDVEPRALPAFYVVPTSEDAAENRLSGGRDQRVAAGLSVMVVVQGARRHRDGVSDELTMEVVRARNALVGWTHPEASKPFDYAGGRLASAAGSVVVWEVKVSSAYHLRKAS